MDPLKVSEELGGQGKTLARMQDVRSDAFVKSRRALTLTGEQSMSRRLQSREREEAGRSLRGGAGESREVIRDDPVLPVNHTSSFD